MCRGEIFFARTCAIDAPSPTHCGGAPATRRRTTDGRAKYISPARAPPIRHHPTIKHVRTMNRGARPIRPHTTVVRAKNISPLRAPTISGHPTSKHRHVPNRGSRPIRHRTTDGRAKNISPLRAPLMRLRPHVSMARPPCAAAPRMCGRNIFRPGVRD